MCTHLRYAAILPILASALPINGVRVSGQTLVQENGRAFDAPGAANASNVPSDAALTNPYSRSVAGSLSSPVRFNAFNISTSLPNLSATIDPTIPLFVQPATFGPATGGGFGLQNIGLPSGVTQPFGTIGSLPSNGLPLTGFEIPALTTTAPSLSVPGGLPFPTFGGIDSNSFDLTTTLALPTPSLSTTVPTTLANPLPPSVEGALSNLDELLLDRTYDEEETIGGVRFQSPGKYTQQTPQRINNPYLRSPTGVIDANFGLTPSSGVASSPLHSELSTDERAGIANDFRVPLIRRMKPLSFDVLSNRATSPAAEAGERDALGTSLPENSLIAETLRQARRTSSGANDAGVIDTSGFGLVESPVTRVTPDYLRAGQAVYAEMKQSVDSIKRLRNQHGELGTDGDRTPVLSETYERAMSYVRGTEREPISSFVGDGLDPEDQFAREAEEYLKKGEYRRALATYEVALVSDRDNPLLLLGQGHALIGTGEHYGAVRKIAKAIENFPEIAYFKLDLNQFITDADLLDIRRADLERRLTEREDYRFRFLLGYIEYYIGLPEYGVTNLNAAAEAAPEGSPIAQFPRMLEIGDELRMQSPEDITRH